jgi:hypothetical protein
MIVRSVLVVLACGIGLACDDEPAQDECERAGSLIGEREPAAHEAGEEDVECEEDDGEFGPPTGSTCPEGSTLTYENFAVPFMTEYCTSCHASTLTGDARQGAPLYHDFDSKNGILAVADHVDWKAAAGPDATNELMPIGSGPVPSLAERQQLGEWLACELAAMQ